MRANIRASQHMWRYDYTSDYIIGRVNASRAELGLNQYRANSTQCAAAAGAGQGSSATKRGSSSYGAELGGKYSSLLGVAVVAFLAWFCTRALRRRAARRKSDPGGYLRQGPGGGKPIVKRLPSGLDTAWFLGQPPSPYSAARRLELDRRRIADV